MAHDRKFRFGVMCGDLRDGPRYLDIARKAEDLGYSTFFSPDHFVDHPTAPIPALAAVAAVTTTLKIGTLVLGNDYRHPVVVATEVAALDQISQGRLEFGLGAGWMKVDYEKAGMPYDRAGVRIDRLEEAITVIKGLFGDGPFSFSGEHYTVTDLDGQPKPFTPGGPPWIIGGGGPRILGVAARHASIVGVNAKLDTGVQGPGTAKNLAAASTDQKLGWLRAAAGDHFDDLEIQNLTGFVHVTDDATAVAERIAAAFEVTPDEALHSPAVLVGSVGEMAEELEARRSRWAMSYHVVPWETMDDFAPVVARLTGT